MRAHASQCVRVRVCACACARACVRACVRARSCARACACVCSLSRFNFQGAVLEVRQCPRIGASVPPNRGLIRRRPPSAQTTAAAVGRRPVRRRVEPAHRGRRNGAPTRTTRWWKRRLHSDSAPTRRRACACVCVRARARVRARVRVRVRVRACHTVTLSFQLSGTVRGGAPFPPPDRTHAHIENCLRSLAPRRGRRRPTAATLIRVKTGLGLSLVSVNYCFGFRVHVSSESIAAIKGHWRVARGPGWRGSRLA